MLTKKALTERQNQFDEYYAEACSDVRHRLVDHFFESNNWTNSQIEEITCKMLYAFDEDMFSSEEMASYTLSDGSIDWEKFDEDTGRLPLDRWTAEYLDDLLCGEDFTLAVLVDYAKSFGVDLTGLEVPYKMIILADGEYTSLDDCDEVVSLLKNEAMIPQDMYLQYVTCQNLDALKEAWEEKLEIYEGAWYLISDGDHDIVSGTYDPNDIDILESLDSYIPKHEFTAKLIGRLDFSEKQNG